VLPRHQAICTSSDEDLIFLRGLESMVDSNSDRPVAIVTGSGTGVGRACIMKFAQRGFDVVVNYSRSATEAEETAQLATDLGARVLTLCHTRRIEAPGR
jgi:NADP-dependent 3-hydroxy acid dehydrogenase YdfG